MTIFIKFCYENKRPKNYYNIIVDLIKTNIDINAFDKYGNTGLIYLCKNGNLDSIISLLV